MKSCTQQNCEPESEATVTYLTTRDIVIPAGTEVGRPPTLSTRWGKDHEAIVEIDADHTGYFTLDASDGVESGLLSPLDD